LKEHFIAAKTCMQKPYLSFSNKQRFYVGMVLHCVLMTKKME